MCNKPETHTETELEVVNFQPDNNTLKTLKPIIGETSPTLNHYGRFSTGTVGCGVVLGATEGDPNLQSSSEQKYSLHDYLSQSIAPEVDKSLISPRQLDEPPAPQIPEIDTNTDLSLIDRPGDNLPTLTFRDRVALIDSPDDHGIGIVIRVQGSIVDVGWTATKNNTAHLISELRVIDRYSDRLNRHYKRLIVPDRQLLQIGDRVRPVDPYHVHGGHIGIVDRVEPWGVYIIWNDRSVSLHSIDDLILIEPTSQNRQL